MIAANDTVFLFWFHRGPRHVEEFILPCHHSLGWLQDLGCSDGLKTSGPAMGVQADAQEPWEGSRRRRGWHKLPLQLWAPKIPL